MKTNLLLILLLTLSLGPIEALGSSKEETYLKQLRAIEKVEGNGTEKTLVLIRKSSDELVKNWSLELASELCRVYDRLLDVNQSHFFSELIESVMEKRKKEFLPVFKKVVSKKNQAAHKEMVRLVEREIREGNG